MNPRFARALLSALLLLAAPLPAAEQVDFAREILPILSNKCFACHGPDTKKKKDLRLDSYAAATAERDGIRAIDPESPEDGELLYRIHDKKDKWTPGTMHIHDLNATILHLLGIDHRKLTYRYQGRDFRLTDIHGHVIHDLLI